MIEIKFLTRFIDITGEKNIKSENVPDINALIEFLCKKYDESFKEVLFDKNGNLRDYLKVMLNGEDIRDIKGVKTSLKDGDQIVMFQTIASG
ncbi:MAG: MoaD/ThiS family protein [Methanobacterium sp.]|nr:MoaD/ThiS family protein [Methanobacterium sp.]